MNQEPSSTKDATISPDKSSKDTVKRKRMRQRSSGWDHFIKYTDKDGFSRVRCKYCPNKTYACDSITNGTSNLLKHSKSCPNNPDHATQQTVLNLHCNNGEKEGEGSLSCWRYDSDAIRSGLTHMLIIDEQSFRFVQKEGFRHFMSIACPRF